MSIGLSDAGIDRERDRRRVTKTKNSNTKPVNIEMYDKCVINDSIF